MGLDASFDTIETVIRHEQEMGHVNSLNDLTERMHSREVIHHHWQVIQTALAQIHQSMKDLPPLPPEGQILWAQAALAMSHVAFMEIDTTGLQPTDELIRFTLIGRDLQTIEDVLIQPTTTRLCAEASKVNGITSEQLEREGVAIVEAWKRIQAALRGHYIISFSQEWDIRQIKAFAERHHLPPVPIIGDDLQRHCTAYYHREYALTLASVCERIGFPLPAHPHQTSLDRAKGQVHITAAIANAVTDVRAQHHPIDRTNTERASATDDVLNEDEPPF